MKTSNYTVNILEPNEGFYLTNKNNPGEILSTKVFLAVTDSADNWIEISIEEGDKLHKEMEEARKAEEEKRNSEIEEAKIAD